MHRAAAAGTATDSMRMFLLGLEGGKPPPARSARSRNGFTRVTVRASSRRAQPIPSPDFALDGSEEPEIAGIYIIDAAGIRGGSAICLANEFSDHVTERGNYLWLAHSKLRPAALGPELLTGELPRDVRGTSRELRDGETLWEKPFLTGEANMSHALANLEHHHFKYDCFAVPATSTCIFLARRPCRSLTAFRRASATCSRSRRRRFVCRCATRWRAQSPSLTRFVPCSRYAKTRTERSHTTNR